MTNLTFVPVEKQIPKAERAFYRDLRQKSVSVDPVDDQLRVYPNQRLAAHVLGYVGMEDVVANGDKLQETREEDGIELVLNAKLAGVPGWRVTETDHKGRELVAQRAQDVEAHDGLNVALTIDSVLQNIVETALADAMEGPILRSASQGLWCARAREKSWPWPRCQTSTRITSMPRRQRRVATA